MKEYKPALTEQEYQRINELMEKLEKVRAREAELTKELRKLIYKTESSQ